jgi:dTDP-4-amino-4,6-dideoxygalactose transaminase
LQIPFLHIKSQYLAIKNEIDEAIARVFASGQFVGGVEVKRFEEKFAAYHGMKHAISTGNGTDSLFAILKMLGIGPGDEVITPAWSWISTSETVSSTGATPIFADADPESFNISISDVERKISPKTKVIMAVHLYGQCCDIGALQKLCSQHNLILMEDCAQAHGAKRNGKFVGTFGVASSFSFYPTKNLGAFGDAGCMLTNDDELAFKLRRFVNHGGLSKDEHLMEGTNSRMDSLQAAILQVKLNHLDGWNEKRISIANRYLKTLSGISSIKLPVTEIDNHHVFHLFVVKTKKRNELQSILKSKGIESMIHYPLALPFEPAYSRFKFSETSFPVAAQLQREVLSLPCHPEMTEAMVDYIGDIVQDFQ